MRFKFCTIAATVALLLASGVRAGIAKPSSDNPKIQGANLRIEFDRTLRSRIIARFDNEETVLGPFTSSESVAGVNQTWSEFPLLSQKQERVSDAFGAGERLILTGK